MTLDVYPVSRTMEVQHLNGSVALYSVALMPGSDSTPYFKQVTEHRWEAEVSTRDDNGRLQPARYIITKVQLNGHEGGSGYSAHLVDEQWRILASCYGYDMGMFKNLRDAMRWTAYHLNGLTGA